MRKVLAALAVLSLEATASASADPGVHQFVVNGRVDQVHVTCDTSAFPAASYPCAFSMVVPPQAGCIEVTSGGRSSGLCSVSLTGTLQALPSLAPDGRCSFQPSGSLTLTVRSGIDPALERVTTHLPFIVQAAVVYYGHIGTQTQTRVNVAGPGGSLTVSLVSAGFGFTDIEGDCRTRAGGDPATGDVRSFWTGPVGEITVGQAS